MAPKNMKSMVMAVSVFTSAIAAAVVEAFNPLAKNPTFVILFGIFSGLAFVGGIIFYIIFRGIDKHQEELNLIGNKPEDHGIQPTNNNAGIRHDEEKVPSV